MNKLELIILRCDKKREHHQDNLAQMLRGGFCASQHLPGSQVIGQYLEPSFQSEQARLDSLARRRNRSICAARGPLGHAVRIQKKASDGVGRYRL